MDKYYDHFGDAVPLGQISAAVKPEDLIEDIQKCLEDNIDYLPEKYGFGTHDGSILY
jgi:hypothetical protein